MTAALPTQIYETIVFNYVYNYAYSCFYIIIIINNTVILLNQLIIKKTKIHTQCLVTKFAAY